ncbi:unnamed protein product [Prorocentrum cordatum]|uniref:Uncharacterized protein n=1 Tax=Prorocentrum cordatum TaxID=2364126 RepID=A0ABN9VFU3_9DINO|nr:unnamed protein product [Polarella glacialis]
MAKMRKVAKQEVDMSDLSKFDLLVRQRMSQKPRQGVLGDQSKEDVPCPAFAELARLAEEACLSRRAQEGASCATCPVCAVRFPASTRSSARSSTTPCCSASGRTRVTR